MPSPFPGMDPYLEDPGLWPDVHHEIIASIKAVLGAQLRPRYVARIEERVYVSNDSDPGRSVIAPDVHVVASRAGESLPAAPGGEGAVLVAEPVVVTTLIEQEVHEPRVEIIDREGRAVVTVIEVLSPANKVRGAKGRESYELKREEVFWSPCHLVEIDLLRGGLVVGSYKRLPPHDYLVHVSPAAMRPKGLAWPIRLDQRLPVVGIPLKPGDTDAPLDLQDVLNTSYERAGYDLDLDYTREPSPPLSPEWAAWADQLLKRKGKRPA
jgi:hypothetical protein